MSDLRSDIEHLSQEERELLALLLHKEGVNLAETVSSALVPLQPEGTQPPLFCLHRDDGLVVCYQLLARCLGPDQPVYGIQAEAISGTQGHFDRVEDMAAHYVSEIRRVYPQGPYRLLGSSFGGILAYEMAQQLRVSGPEVGFLALLDTFAPVALRDALFMKPALGRAAVHLDVLKQLEPRARLAYIMNKMKGRIQETERQCPKFDADGENIVGYMPEAIAGVQQANAKAYQKYEPKYYPGPILMFRADELNYFDNYDPLLWWGAVLADRMEVIDVPGNHLTMLKEPSVRVLAERIRGALKDRERA